MENMEHQELYKLTNCIICNKENAPSPLGGSAAAEGSSWVHHHRRRQSSPPPTDDDDDQEGGSVGVENSRGGWMKFQKGFSAFCKLLKLDTEEEVADGPLGKFLAICGTHQAFPEFQRESTGGSRIVNSAPPCCGSCVNKLLEVLRLEEVIEKAQKQQVKQLRGLKVSVRLADYLSGDNGTYWRDIQEVLFVACDNDHVKESPGDVDLDTEDDSDDSIIACYESTSTTARRTANVKVEREQGGASEETLPPSSSSATFNPADYNRNAPVEDNSLDIRTKISAGASGGGDAKDNSQNEDEATNDDVVSSNEGSSGKGNLKRKKSALLVSRECVGGDPSPGNQKEGGCSTSSGATALFAYASGDVEQVSATRSDGERIEHGTNIVVNPGMEPGPAAGQMRSSKATTSLLKVGLSKKKSSNAKGKLAVAVVSFPAIPADYVASQGHVVDGTQTKASSARSAGTVHFCTLCQKSFNHKGDLKKHLRVHSGEKPYTCTLCKRSFSQSSHLKGHMSTHNSLKPLACSTCGKQFALQQHLYQHSFIHKTRGHSCVFCGKAFALNSGLNTHLRTHTREKPNFCKTCGKEFSTQSNLVDHIRTHTLEKLYECVFCRRSFNRPSHLEAHIRGHVREKPFFCKKCNAEFAINAGLKYHCTTTRYGKKGCGCNE